MELWLHRGCRICFCLWSRQQQLPVLRARERSSVPGLLLSMPGFTYTEMDCVKSAWWRGKHPFFEHYFLLSKLASSDFSEKCFNIPMNASQQISITGIAEISFPPLTYFFFCRFKLLSPDCCCIRVRENAGAFCRKLSYCANEGQENGSAIIYCRLSQFALGAYLWHLSCIICTNGNPHGVFSLE